MFNYKKLITLFTLSVLWSLSGTPTTLAAEPAYVGIEGCSCHRSEITFWKRSKHARAFRLLKAGIFKAAKKKAKLDPAEDYTEDEGCVKCHVTGYKKRGGFVSLAVTPSLAVIGCEVCHGPGSEYRVLHKRKAINFTKKEAMAAGQLYSSLDDAVCRSCHLHKDTPFQAEVDEKYDFDLQEAIKDAGSFHPMGRLRGKH